MYNLIFNEVISRQLIKAKKNNHIKEILKKMIDKIE